MRSPRTITTASLLTPPALPLLSAVVATPESVSGGKGGSGAENDAALSTPPTPIPQAQALAQQQLSLIHI